MTSSILAARGVSLAFAEKRILDDVSFDVAPGEVLSLIGPNGAGKSTLLSVLAGDRKPDTGSVTMFGEPLMEIPVKVRARQRAVLEQRPTVGFAFRVREVVAMGRAPWHGTPAATDDATIVDESIRAVEIEHLVYRDVLTLSGGESSRMSIARVLAQRTPVVLLDEPAAALDVRHQEHIMELARQLAAQGSSVVVVSHDLDSAAHWSDRVALLQRGRLRAIGSPADVLDGALLSDVYDTPIEVFRHPVTGAPVVRPVRRSPAAS